MRIHIVILILLISFISGCSNSQDNPNTSGYATDYVIILDGFDSTSRLEVEEGLINLNGYYNHRISMTTNTHTEYWYQTNLGSAALDRGIHQMLHSLGLVSVVQFSGNTFNIIAANGRKYDKEKVNTDQYEW